MRRTAAYALASVGPKAKGAAVALLRAARDPDALTRVWAIKALGEVDAQSVLPVLDAALCDADLDVRRMAVGAGLPRLGAKAEPVLPALCRTLRDDDFGIRWRTCIALREMGPAAAAATETLIAALANVDGEVRMRAYQALGAIGRGAALLSAALAGASGPSRRSLAEILKTIESPIPPCPVGGRAPSPAAATAAAARAAWYNEAKFGLFIHWGLSACPPAPGRANCPNGSCATERIAPAEYEKFADKFTAARFDPRQWGPPDPPGWPCSTWSSPASTTTASACGTRRRSRTTRPGGPPRSATWSATCRCLQAGGHPLLHLLLAVGLAPSGFHGRLSPLRRACPPADRRAVDPLQKSGACGSTASGPIPSTNGGAVRSWP